MESSIKEQKSQSLKKKNKRAQFLYNIILYSLTSCITCLFFSYPFWYPSMKQLLFSLPNTISLLFNAKSIFILGNIIVLILVGESKRTQSSHPSPASEIYDEYVARSRRSYAKVNSKIPPKVKEKDETFIPNVEARNIIHNMHNHVEKKKVLAVSKSMHHHKEEKRRGMRTCQSEVWGGSEIVKVKENDKTTVPNSNVEARNIIQDDIHNPVEKKKGLGVSKSKHHLNEEKKRGMRTCKSEVWGGSEIVKVKENDTASIPSSNIEPSVNVQENMHNHEEKKKELSVSMSMQHHQEEEKKNGMRKCKSEVWGQSEIVKRKTNKERNEDLLGVQTEELNKRVEAFIARVNKQRLLEAKV